MESVEMSGENSAKPSIHSPSRWVTFEDLVEEALEEGKLSPTE